MGYTQGADAVTPRTSAPPVEGGGSTAAESQAEEAKGRNGAAAMRGAVTAMTEAKANGHPQVAPVSKN